MGNSAGAVGWAVEGVRRLRPRRHRGPGVGLRPGSDLAANPDALPSGGVQGVWAPARAPGEDSYLVDSASSHMLVSKIKPCMSKYKQSIR